MQLCESIACPMQDAAAEVASGATRAPGLEIDLDGVKTCWLNAHSLLMALKDGRLWQVNLVLANNIVDELKVRLGYDCSFEWMYCSCPAQVGLNTGCFVCEDWLSD